MLRLARYTRDLMTNIQTCIEVGILSIAALQASKHRLVSERMPRTTAGAGERSVGGIHDPNRHPCHSGQQQNALREESRTPLFPPWETVRILKSKTSTRLESTAHQRSGVFSLGLSLRGHFIGPIAPLLLVESATVALFLQDGSQVGCTVTVRTGHRPAHAHVTADKFLDGLFVGHWNFHGHTAVPLAVFSEDLALLTQRSTGIRQGSVNRSMFAGRDVQLPHTLHHDPQIEAFCFARGLDLGGINQFSFQHPRLMPGFSGASPVRECTTVGSTGKLAHAFRRRAAGLLTKRSCARCVMPRKESRQETERIGFVSNREKFQFVTEDSVHIRHYNRDHPPCKVSFAPVYRGNNGPLRLRLGDLWKFAPAGHANFVGEEKP